MNGHVPSDGDWAGAMGAGEARWGEVVLASGGGTVVRAVAVSALAGVLGRDSAAGEHGCGCWCG